VRFVDADPPLGDPRPLDGSPNALTGHSLAAVNSPVNKEPWNER